MADLRVAQTILEQMGGAGRLGCMVGAHNFVGSEQDGSLTFRFKGSRKANCCRITLNAMDLYRVEILKINNRTYDIKTVVDQNDVYNDMLKDLFESTTGLYLSL